MYQASDLKGRLTVREKRIEIAADYLVMTRGLLTIVN
jgi:hypothetical protein